jgi:hypothetical protein
LRPGSQGASILKSETSYAGPPVPGKPNIVWNDLDGGPIEQVHFADALQYSTKKADATASGTVGGLNHNGDGGPKGACCVVSWQDAERYDAFHETAREAYIDTPHAGVRTLRFAMRDEDFVGCARTVN